MKLLFLFILIMFSTNIFAESISIVGIDVLLGMNKSKVYSDFQNYKIQCLDNTNKVLIFECDSWLISTTNQSHEPLANIAFNENKVSNVIKYYNFEQEPTLNEFYQVFYLVLNQITKNGAKIISVQSKETIQGSVIQKAIFLVDGRKSINLRYMSSVTSNGVFIPASVTISEEIR